MQTILNFKQDKNFPAITSKNWEPKHIETGAYYNLNSVTGPQAKTQAVTIFKEMGFEVEQISSNRIVVEGIELYFSASESRVTIANASYGASHRFMSSDRLQKS